MPWHEPSLSLRWGPYTKLDGEEQSKVVDSTIAAKNAGVITLRMAVEKISGIYGIENVDAALEAISKESEENHQTTVKRTAEMTAATAKADPNQGAQ